MSAVVKNNHILNAHEREEGNMERLLLKPHEAAEMLGISRTKLYQLLARAKLPSIRVGSSLRVPLEELRQWIREQGM
jgi:excisionase family DNA binding protein